MRQEELAASLRAEGLSLVRNLLRARLEDQMPSTVRPDIVHTDVEGANMKVHKAEYSDMCTVCGPRMKTAERRHSHILAFKESLTDFGYTGLTHVQVAEAYDKAMAGPIIDSDIIAMFIRRELEENDLVSHA